MKLNELAAKIGRNPSTISRWFSGSRRISATDAAELECATGIDRRAWLWPDEFPNPMLKKNGNGQKDQVA